MTEILEAIKRIVRFVECQVTASFVRQQMREFSSDFLKINLFLYITTAITIANKNPTNSSPEPPGAGSGVPANKAANKNLTNSSPEPPGGGSGWCSRQ